MCDQQSLRSACAYAQSDQILCLSLEYLMSVKLLTEHNLRSLSLKGSCTGSSESNRVKIPHCVKSHALAQYYCFCCSYCLWGLIDPCFVMQFLVSFLVYNHLADPILECNTCQTTGHSDLPFVTYSLHCL